MQRVQDQVEFKIDTPDDDELFDRFIEGGKNFKPKLIKRIASGHTIKQNRRNRKKMERKDAKKARAITRARG